MRVRIQAIACSSRFFLLLTHACPHTHAWSCVNTRVCVRVALFATKALRQADTLAAQVDIRALLDIGAREAVLKKQ